jgi:hypothetical protein
MLRSTKPNDETRCCLCLKDKLDNWCIKEDDFISLIIHHRSLNDSKSGESLTNVLNHQNMDIQSLIKPCKCGTYFHIPCLIQLCISHLSFKCEECQSEYNFEFKDLGKCEGNSVIIQAIFTIIFHLGLLALTIMFFIVEIIPSKFKFWNYIIGIVILFINIPLFIGHFSIFYYKYRHSKKLYPIFEDYIEGHKRSENDYEKMRIFLEQVLKSNMYELTAKTVNNKFFITSIINPEKEIMHYIQNNNSEEFKIDNEKIKDELKEEELENKFHGHQIIKSTLVMNDQNAIKNMLSKHGTNCSASQGDGQLPRSRTKGNNKKRKDSSSKKKVYLIEIGTKDSLKRIKGDNSINNNEDGLIKGTETVKDDNRDEIINKETNRDNKDKDHMTGEKQAVETLNMIKGNNANEKDILRLDDN